MVRKARVNVDDNNHVLAKYYELLVDDFAYGNLIQFSSAVNTISEQVNPFKRQSSVCVRACWVHDYGWHTLKTAHARQDHSLGT